MILNNVSWEPLGIFCEGPSNLGQPKGGIIKITLIEGGRPTLPMGDIVP